MNGMNYMRQNSPIEEGWRDPVGMIQSPKVVSNSCTVYILKSYLYPSPKCGCARDNLGVKKVLAPSKYPLKWPII
jgi:hypothetical protein